MEHPDRLGRLVTLLQAVGVGWGTVCIFAQSGKQRRRHVDIVQLDIALYETVKLAKGVVQS